MGCFSFICKECGKPILSDSFRGQKVKLFLLKEGKVIQEMEGEYDSYGRVFTEKHITRDLRESVYWKDPTPETPLDDYWAKQGVDDPDNHGYWLRVCRLMHDSDEANGIAAIHSACFVGNIPTTRSKDDPDQGWGEDWEYLVPSDGEVTIL